MDAGGGEGVARVDLVRGGAIAEIPEVIRAGGRVAGELDGGQKADGRGRCEVRYGCGSDFHALLHHLGSSGSGDDDAHIALSCGAPFDFRRGFALGGAVQTASGHRPVIGVLVGVGGDDGRDGVLADVDAVRARCVHDRSVVEDLIGIDAGLQEDGGTVAFGLFAFHDDGDSCDAAAVGRL